MGIDHLLEKSKARLYSSKPCNIAQLNDDVWRISKEYENKGITIYARWPDVPDPDQDVISTKRIVISLDTTLNGKFYSVEIHKIEDPIEDPTGIKRRDTQLYEALKSKFPTTFSETPKIDIRYDDPSFYDGLNFELEKSPYNNGKLTIVKVQEGFVGPTYERSGFPILKPEILGISEKESSAFKRAETSYNSILQDLNKKVPGLYEIVCNKELKG